MIVFIFLLFGFALLCVRIIYIFIYNIYLTRFSLFYYNYLYTDLHYHITIMKQSNHLNARDYDRINL